MTAKQCKMARAGLGWTPRQLAFKADVALGAVSRFEKGLSVARTDESRMRIAFMQHGVTFFTEMDRIKGDGVHLA